MVSYLFVLLLVLSQALISLVPAARVSTAPSFNSPAQPTTSTAGKY